MRTPGYFECEGTIVTGAPYSCERGTANGPVRWPDRASTRDCVIVTHIGLDGTITKVEHYCSHCWESR